MDQNTKVILILLSMFLLAVIIGALTIVIHNINFTRLILALAFSFFVFSIYKMDKTKKDYQYGGSKYKEINYSVFIFFTSGIFIFILSQVHAKTKYKNIDNNYFFGKRRRRR